MVVPVFVGGSGGMPYSVVKLRGVLALLSTIKVCVALLSTIRVCECVCVYVSRWSVHLCGYTDEQVCMLHNRVLHLICSQTKADENDIEMLYHVSGQCATHTTHTLSHTHTHTHTHTYTHTCCNRHTPKRCIQ